MLGFCAQNSDKTCMKNKQPVLSIVLGIHSLTNLNINDDNWGNNKGEDCLNRTIGIFNIIAHKNNNIYHTHNYIII